MCFVNYAVFYIIMSIQSPPRDCLLLSSRHQGIAYCSGHRLMAPLLLLPEAPMSLALTERERPEGMLSSTRPGRIAAAAVEDEEEEEEEEEEEDEDEEEEDEDEEEGGGRGPR